VCGTPSSLVMILCQVMRIVFVRGIMHKGNMFLISEIVILMGMRTKVMFLSSPCEVWKPVISSYLATEYPFTDAYLRCK
jgi:hypothetical protein